jgi:hypothetical protein
MFLQFYVAYRQLRAALSKPQPSDSEVRDLVRQLESARTATIVEMRWHAVQLEDAIYREGFFDLVLNIREGLKNKKSREASERQIQTLDGAAIDAIVSLEPSATALKSSITATPSLPIGDPQLPLPSDNPN